MFGQNNQQNHQDDAQIPEQAIDGALTAETPVAPTPVTPAAATPWQHPGVPMDTPAVVTPTDPVAAPAAPAADALPNYGTPAPTPVAALIPVNMDPAVSQELLEIKQHALTELSPLVDHLEQNPEEKFRTTMMLIQASDNQNLIAVAYEAALTIEDEKTRAQALLDVINEINYFTQQAQQAS
jgi:hypothetical protein